MQHVLGVVALLTGLGLVVVACGGGKASEGEAGKNTPAGGQESQVDLPKFPKAPSDAENPRLRGSQEMSNKEFVQWLVKDANTKWQATFASNGYEYLPAGFKAYNFNKAVESACGVLGPKQGPFYCPADQTVYWAPNWPDAKSFGDFAVAYGMSHEVGHHVQEQMGILDLYGVGVYTSRQIELQADCFAGVWGYSVYYEGLIESGDIDEALNAASAFGDLPEQPRGGPGAHGSPEERVQWYQTGYDYGDGSRCMALTPLPQETTSPETTVGG
jgi:predicted metalloprotease